VAKGNRTFYRATLARPFLLALLLALGCGKNRKEEARCPEPAAPQVAAAAGAREEKQPSDAGGEEGEALKKTLRAKMPASDPARPSRGMIRMEVLGVGQGGFGGISVLLQEKSGQRRVMPIWIGDREGQVIDLRLRGEKFERPLTHDLLDAVLRDRGMTVARVEVDGLRDGTFLGRLFLADEEGRVTRLDARPSDCIALAVGAGAPIFVDEKVLDQTGVPAESIGIEE
jgi:bifunctional DNase/RNase